MPESKTLADEESLVTEAQAKSSAANETAILPKKPRRWPWLVILFLILTGLAGWFALPQDTRQSYLENIRTHFIHPNASSDPVMQESMAESEQSQPEQQVSPEEATVAEEPALNDPPAAGPEPEEPDEPPVKTQLVPETGSMEIDAAILERLIDAVGELRTGIDELKASNSELKSSLEARRILDLKSRLRWLTNRNMPLSQIKLAWEDIALLPALAYPDRELARKMVDLSSHDLKENSLWLQSLDGFLDKYPSAPHKKTEMIADDSWWAWINNLFRLHRAPGAALRQQNELHTNLLLAHNKLSRQQWPDQTAWNSLLAAILEQEGEDTDINLPEDFREIEHDIARMREAAATWLGRL